MAVRPLPPERSRLVDADGEPLGVPLHTSGDVARRNVLPPSFGLGFFSGFVLGSLFTSVLWEVFG